MSLLYIIIMANPSIRKQPYLTQGHKYFAICCFIGFKFYSTLPL